jgi:hypothetical protein
MTTMSGIGGLCVREPLLPRPAGAASSLCGEKAKSCRPYPIICEQWLMHLAPLTLGPMTSLAAMPQFVGSWGHS